jgi:hypothetical protein
VTVSYDDLSVAAGGALAAGLVSCRVAHVVGAGVPGRENAGFCQIVAGGALAAGLVSCRVAHVVGAGVPGRRVPCPRLPYPVWLTTNPRKCWWRSV